MSTKDRVTLSVRERHELAHLQSMLETADPELAKLLAGHQRRGAEVFRQWASLGAHYLASWSRRPWLAPLVTVGGIVGMVGALTWVAWVSIPAALVVAAGLGPSLSNLGGALGQWAERRRRWAGTGPGGPDDEASSSPV